MLKQTRSTALNPTDTRLTVMATNNKAKMKMYFGDVHLAIKRGKYHPLAEHSKMQRKLEKSGQFVPHGKFHQLTKKLERTLPRSFRDEGGAFTTELILEIINEDREV
jgi:hypothetical protein